MIHFCWLEFIEKKHFVWANQMKFLSTHNWISEMKSKQIRRSHFQHCDAFIWCRLSLSHFFFLHSFRFWRMNKNISRTLFNTNNGKVLRRYINHGQSFVLCLMLEVKSTHTQSEKIWFATIEGFGCKNLRSSSLWFDIELLITLCFVLAPNVYSLFHCAHTSHCV